MDKKSYLQFCRYYKCENECPKNVKLSFWEYEKKWIELSLHNKEELGNMLNDYLSYQLRDFDQMDNTPITLKALLFNRYSHWMGCDTKGFKEWYKHEYVMAD